MNELVLLGRLVQSSDRIENRAERFDKVHKVQNFLPLLIWK